MASSPAPAPGQPGTPRLLETLARYRSQVTVALLVLAALFAVLPIYLIARHGFQSALGSVFVWGVAMALVALIAALVYATGGPDPRLSEPEKLRLLLMGLGGLWGALTALLGLVLPFTYYSGQLGGGLSKWREHPGAVAWPTLSFVGGLVLTFLSLQLGRGLEHTDPRVRRLLYGFNALLTTILLIAILAVPNLLAFAEPFTRFFGRTEDWTRSRVNELAPQSRNLLADLREPVHVVLLMGDNEIESDMRTLLNNCRTLTNKVTWEQVSPLVRENQTRIVGFLQKYKLPGTEGALVVVGTEPNARSEFIKITDLYQNRPGRPGERPNYAFAGESALMDALATLTDEKKVVFYFTQGAGELTLSSAPGGERESSLGALRTRLTRRKNIEVKELRLGPGGARRVPDDASAVVVARPTRTLSDDTVKALRDYMRGGKKGRLMVLLEPITRKEGGTTTVVPTGLEGLFAEFNVKVGNDRVLRLIGRDPLAVQAYPPYPSTNPVARAFRPDPRSVTVFTFYNARTVDSAGAGGGYTTDRLMILPREQRLVIDTRFRTSAADLADALRADPEERQKRESPNDVSIAVVVSESGARGMPRDAAHAGMLKETPRMVVFGSSEWVTDATIGGRFGDVYADLFESCLNWMREKSAIGLKIPPKERPSYTLNVPETGMKRLLYLPLGLILLGIIGLGCGVWVVRRR